MWSARSLRGELGDALVWSARSLRGELPVCAVSERRAAVESCRGSARSLRGELPGESCRGELPWEYFGGRRRAALEK